MFKLHSNKFKFLFSPDDSSGSSTESLLGNESKGSVESDDKDDIIKFMGDDDDTSNKDDIIDLDEKKEKVKKESKDTKDDTKEQKSKEKNKDKDDEDEDESDDDDDELEELISDLDEPNEEQLELTTPVRRREILKKYPELFKDFPYLEKAYYREQQFTELLPTIDDAKQAVAKSETLDRFETDLMKGNTETILKAVKETDADSFAKIVDDYLPTLSRIDPAAYQHVLGNTLRHTIIAMVTEANRSNNDVLKSAAQILNQFAFGTSNFVPPSKMAKDAPKDDGKKSEIDEERRKFTQERFTIARTDLNSKINNSLKATIETNIDPKSSMTDYVKKTAIRDANDTLAKMLTTDARFKTIVDRLWDNAFKKNFDQESVGKIRSAYMSKARTLLPAVIKKARNEALKGMGKRVVEDKDDNTGKERRQTDRPRSNRSGNDEDSNKGGVPKGMSALEFLNKD